jgi:hypothetical protein
MGRQNLYDSSSTVTGSLWKSVNEREFVFANSVYNSFAEVEIGSGIFVFYVVVCLPLVVFRWVKNNLVTQIGIEVKIVNDQ